MAESIKKNFFWNLILTLCGYVFPLITYPYVSRVLGVSNIGICDFVDSIINFFVIFAQLGIRSYGVREIARCKGDPVRRNEVFNNLFFLNIVTFLMATVVLVVCTFTVPTMVAYKPFLLVGCLKLVFSLFLIEWFFQGIEDFKYITIRSVVVRTIYVVAVFVFVHTAADTLIYYAITTLTIVLNAIWDWNYSRRFIRLSFRKLRPKMYIMPILIFGYYRILTSLYTTLNEAYLGFATDSTQVGYFSTATKFYTIVIAAFTAFTTVMIPRVSAMLSEGLRDELQKMIDQIVHLLVSLSIPVIIFCILNAHAVILLFSGPGYEGAEVPFRVIIFLLLVIGLEQIIIQQCLMSSTKTRLTAVVSTVGAVMGIVCNIILTPRYGALGTAISWGSSELAVLAVGLVLIRRHLGIVIRPRGVFMPMLYVGFYFLIVWGVMRLVPNMWVQAVVSLVLLSGMFLVINLFWDKDPLLTALFDRKFRKGKKEVAE